MPMYHYKCRQHGVFEELQTVAQAPEPQDCPQCGQSSPRVFVISPKILDMSPARRKAMETNERNAHEPLVSSKADRDVTFDHGPSCSCCSSKPRKSRTVYLGDGSKVFPADRPWMISH
jgi:putative FmdB family regulatory protein